MPPFLTGITANLIGVAVAALLAASAVGWTVHKVDAAAYLALQLADANALNEQMIKDAAAVQEFNERAATAMEATDAKLKTLTAARAVQAQQFQIAVATEEHKNAPLAACLAMPLPADILAQLPK